MIFDREPVNGWILIHEIRSLDLSQIFHSCCSLMRDLVEIQFMDLSIKIHPLTVFCLCTQFYLLNQLGGINILTGMAIYVHLILILMCFWQEILGKSMNINLCSIVNLPMFIGKLSSFSSHVHAHCCLFIWAKLCAQSHRISAWHQTCNCSSPGAAKRQEIEYLKYIVWHCIMLV